MEWFSLSSAPWMPSRFSMASWCMVVSSRLTRTIRFLSVFYTVLYTDIRCNLFYTFAVLQVKGFPILLTKNVSVVGALTGICNWISRIESVDLLELFHQRHKTVHVTVVLIHIYCCYIFICDTDLDIIGRK